MKSRLASKFHIFVLLPLPHPYSFDALCSFNRALGFLHVRNAVKSEISDRLEEDLKLLHPRQLRFVHNSSW